MFLFGMCVLMYLLVGTYIAFLLSEQEIIFGMWEGFVTVIIWPCIVAVGTVQHIIQWIEEYWSNGKGGGLA